jgi:FkbM family methyltransferase
VDPQKVCCDNVAALKLPNVVVKNFAAWNNIGRLMFRTHIIATGERQGAIAGVDGFIIATGEADRGEVPCQPLDFIDTIGSLDFLKMDVDGAEVPAMVGAQVLLQRHKPTLLIETHNDESRAFLLVWLKKFGYEPRILEEPRFGPDPKRWTDETNYLFAPRA